MATINIKRIYSSFAKEDGFRILVDRLWPRGIKKDEAHIDVWLKDVGPSTELRKWFDHDVAKWKSFSAKYTAELKKSPAVKELLGYVKEHKKVTFLYGTKDEAHNQAVVLSAYVNGLLKNKTVKSK